MQLLTIWDFFLTPIFLIIFIALAKRHRNRRYPVGHPLRKYYLPGFYAKIGGAIFIGLIYAYYYKGGDTFNFFYHSKIINSAFTDSLGTWFKLIRRVPVDADFKLYPYVSQMYWYVDPPSYMVAVIGAIIGLFNGTHYLPTAITFAYISYTGIWAMYKTFATLYPKLDMPLAIAFLFIPSTFVWGSAIFKDTVCMFGLGWLTYTTFRIFINKDFSLKNLSLLVISFYLVAVIKVYILLAFLPALCLWLLMMYSNKIRSAGIRWMVNILSVGVAIMGFLFFTQQFAEELNHYSLEKIAKTAEVTREWIAFVSETQEGSAYDLGDFEPTPAGMFSKLPAAVNVTLFRPYIWEAKKPIMFLSALEALAFLCLTLYVFFKIGLWKTFKNISKDPNLTFFAIYSIIFAFAVGISTYNFGSLSRYKIPCMPFFAALLFILYYQDKISKAEKDHERIQRRPIRHIA